MLNELGKYLKKKRIEQDVTLKDVAIKYGVSPAFISAIENGKKNPPNDFYSKTIKIYQIKDNEKENYNKAYLSSLKEIKINLSNLTNKQKKQLFLLWRGEIC